MHYVYFLSPSAAYKRCAGPPFWLPLLDSRVVFGAIWAIQQALERCGEHLVPQHGDDSQFSRGIKQCALPVLTHLVGEYVGVDFEKRGRYPLQQTVFSNPSFQAIHTTVLLFVCTGTLRWGHGKILVEAAAYTQ